MSDMKKTVVLTGASRGIGHATVMRFSSENWRIITCSREEPPAACGRDPNWTHHIPTDLAESASVDRFLKKANEVLGDTPLHALVNNAAISPKTPIKERLGCLNGPIDGWRKVFDLNLFAPLVLSRGFATALSRGAKDGGAAIVNITSIAGHFIHPFAGSAYSTSKAALSALTREMAVEFAQLGVRVNAVAPGEIETEMVGDEYEPLINRIPMHRMGTAAEVAGCVYQLVNPDFGYVTGTEVFVTGGQHVY
jgi:NAD(P)-dependent dehydrogenase (short-subunit alcohol dehydrogenase family)